MRVEVKTAEAHGLSMPRSFRFNEREIEVTEILDQWFGADHRYCKLKGNDGALYILRLDENRSECSLIMFASPEAQALAQQSGASSHPQPPSRNSHDARASRPSPEDGEKQGRV